MRTIDIDIAAKVCHRDRRTLHNRAQRGLAPQPIKRGPGVRYLYRVAEIAEWLGLRIEEVEAEADRLEAERRLR